MQCQSWIMGTGDFWQWLISILHFSSPEFFPSLPIYTGWNGASEAVSLPYITCPLLPFFPRRQVFRCLPGWWLQGGDFQTNDGEGGRAALGDDELISAETTGEMGWCLPLCLTLSFTLPVSLTPSFTLPRACSPSHFDRYAFSFYMSFFFFLYFPLISLLFIFPSFIISSLFPFLSFLNMKLLTLPSLSLSLHLSLSLSIFFCTASSSSFHFFSFSYSIFTPFSLIPYLPLPSFSIPLYLLLCCFFFFSFFLLFLFHLLT